MKIYVVMAYDIIDGGEVVNAFVDAEKANECYENVVKWEDTAYAIIHTFEADYGSQESKKEEGIRPKIVHNQGT